MQRQLRCWLHQPQTWLINNSSKPSIQRIPLPTRCMVPNIYDDSSPTSKEKKSRKKERLEENSFGGGTYYFSSAHTPTSSTSVYESTPKFAEAIMKNKSPQLFVYGGNRTSPHKAASAACAGTIRRWPLTGHFRASPCWPPRMRRPPPWTRLRRLTEPV